MVCRFLETLSLASLIAPVSEEEFRSVYWEQRPLVVHRQQPDYYGDLFTLRDFDGAITRTPDYVKLANAVANKNASYQSMMAEGLEAVLTDMRNGGTLVLDHLHHREPNLSLLCTTLAAELGHRFQTNLYLTPANGKGFSPHWDNHDVFIIQVVGSKHWSIEKQRRIFPRKDDSMEEEGRELRGAVDSFVLEQGDIIYIPRGYVHAAECGAEASLHITLGFTATFWEDILGATVKAAVIEDERLRQVMPLGFSHAPREALVKRLRGMLREMSDETFLNRVIEQYLDELVRMQKLDISHQVLEFFSPKRPLTLDCVMTTRRAIYFQMHAGDNSIRLNYGARSIVFPHFFREALEFSLKGATFAIRDLPGDLQDEERIAFAERLLEEGLLVRHEGGEPQQSTGAVASYA